MTEEDRWQRWFHDRHAMPELARWACGLRRFRFCRAYGHAIDGDSFIAALRYRSLGDLLGVLDQLGIPARRLPPDVPQPLPGQSYSGDVFGAFPSVVTAHPTVEQPDHVRIAAAATFVWVNADRIDIHVSDEAEVYDVSEAAFEAAQRIEALLAPLASRTIDPPRDNRHCLCPAFYPEVFAACG